MQHNAPFADTLFPTVADHVRQLVKWMSESIFEKEQLAAMSLLCAVAGENIFLLGPPGTAKSMVSRRLKGVFRGARSFDYLMSRFSTPDEIFGPISIARLKECDRYERLTEGYLPSADVVFLDEIWKAGPSIQNTLLTAINEHIYQNGSETMHLPMKALIAASNELPGSNEGLEALWDRFLVRMVSNCIEDDDNFERMLLDQSAERPLDPALQLTDELYRFWQTESAKTGISGELMKAIKWLRHSLRRISDNKPNNGDGKVLDLYVSDRRWKKSFRLMQTSAYLNGRREIDSSDMLLLIHCLWNAPECREEINRQVANSIWHGITEENFSINDTLRAIVAPEQPSGRKNAASFVPESDFALVYNSYYAIEDFKNGTGVITKWDYNRLSFLDETDAVEFIDTGMRMPVFQVMKSNSAFDFNVSSVSGKPHKAKLMKCSGGIVIDGIPYSITRKGISSGIKSQSGAAVKKRELGALKKRYKKCVSDWSQLQKRIAAEAKANIFVSALDIDMVESAMEAVSTQLTETEIRIVNIERILS